MMMMIVELIGSQQESQPGAPLRAIEAEKKIGAIQAVMGMSHCPPGWEKMPNIVAMTSHNSDQRS